jgi:hypothetical protein
MCYFILGTLLYIDPVSLLPLLSLEIIEIGSKSCCMVNLKFVFHFLVPWLEFVNDLSFIHSFACLCWACKELIVNLILQLVVKVLE